MGEVSTDRSMNCVCVCVEEGGGWCGYRVEGKGPLSE
jgi:hypothetical protein